MEGHNNPLLKVGSELGELRDLCQLIQHEPLRRQQPDLVSEVCVEGFSRSEPTEPGYFGDLDGHGGMPCSHVFNMVWHRTQEKARVIPHRHVGWCYPAREVDQRR